MPVRGLVLSGGGSHGAFQVGVLKYLVHVLKRKYTYAYGTSIGAFNGAAIAMFKDEADAMQWLETQWLNLETKDVWKRWFPFGMLHGLWKTSFRNSKPLHEYLLRKLDVNAIKANGKGFGCGSVQLANGRHVLFEETYPDLHAAILASSAFPTMLLPIPIDGKLCIDGGVRNATPLKAAIDRGAEEIDVILTEPDEQAPRPEPGNALDVGIYCLGTMSHEVFINDIKICELVNELVAAGKRPDKKEVTLNIFKPKTSLEGDGLEFVHDVIKRKIQLGYEIAQEVAGSHGRIG